MKICIITTGTGGLPLPPVKGGAVENLVDMYLKYNERVFHDDIVVYSCESKQAEVIAKNYKFTQFRYISVRSMIYLIDQRIRFLVNKINGMCLPNAFISRVNFKEDFDVVLIENRPDYGQKVRSFYSGKILLHLHNDIIDNSKKRYKIDSKTYDEIITVSNYISNCVTKKLPDAKTVSLYNGIDWEKFYPNENNKKKGILFREKLGISASDKVVLFAGRINKEKGIMELLKAFLELPKEKQIKLVIVGSSVYGRTALDEFTKEVIHVAENRKDDIFFTGYVDYSDMPGVYHMADTIVIPSVWDDPSPLTAYESLATGIPLVVSDSGGIPEIIEGSNASVVKRDDDFVNHLREAISDALDQNRAQQDRNINRAQFLSVKRYCETMHSIIKGE